MFFLTIFFRSGGAPGRLREYRGLLRSEKSVKIIHFMMEKNLHYKGDKITILRGSKVRCLNPPEPGPDPKNQEIQMPAPGPPRRGKVFSFSRIKKVFF